MTSNKVLNDNIHVTSFNTKRFNDLSFSLKMITYQQLKNSLSLNISNTFSIPGNMKTTDNGEVIYHQEVVIYQYENDQKAIIVYDYGKTDDMDKGLALKRCYLVSNTFDIEAFYQTLKNSYTFEAIFTDLESLLNVYGGWNQGPVWHLDNDNFERIYDALRTLDFDVNELTETEGQTWYNSITEGSLQYAMRVTGNIDDDSLMGKTIFIAAKHGEACIIMVHNVSSTHPGVLFEPRYYKLITSSRDIEEFILWAIQTM